MELIKLAVMPIHEAKALQDQLKKENIDIVLNHDDATCTRGCTVTVEVTGRESDAPKIAQIYHDNFKKLTDGHEVNWEAIDSVFDPNAEMAVCPACTFEFKPTSNACPDCGLEFL